VLPDLDLRVVAGEPAAALAGGGLRCDVPYDLDAVRPALAVAKTEASATADMTTCDWPVAGPVRPAPPLGAGGLG